VSAPVITEPDLPVVGWVRRYFTRVAGGMAVFPLAVLFVMHFVDEFDTAAFAVLAPEIQRSFDLSDTAFGVIVILNLSVILLLAVPLGYYGDRLPRTKLVVGGGIVSAIFSFLTGLANSVAALVLVRIGNGVGVLVNDPIHSSLLSDYYKPTDRPLIYATHRNAARFAAIVGPMFAGVIAALFGWRAAFMVLLVPIMAMAIVATRLKEPVRGATDDEDAALVAAHERPVSLGRASRMLFSVRTLRRQYMAWMFIGAGYIPLTFMIPQYYEREFGLGTFERGLVIGVGAAAGLAGVQAGGRWARGWLAQGMGVPLKWAGWSLFAVGPFLALLAAAPRLWLAVPISVTSTFVGGIFTPAFYTTQAFVAPARIRSLAFSFGAVFLVAGLWLLVLNPVIGILDISDQHGVRWGLFALFPFWLIGGLLLRSAHRFAADDAQRALDILVTTAELRKARTSANRSAILVVRDLDVSYGPVQVLFGVDLELHEGEIIALLGTNGAGKSTLLRAISGLVPPQRGAIFFDGEDVTGLEPEDSFSYGLVQVPGGRGIFPGLTVKENLDVAAWASRRPRKEVDAVIEDLLELFPALGRRYAQPAGVLSGGEQQMLTLGQAFIAKPKLLMIDELSLGLAPIVIEELLQIVRRIHAEGTSVILVEQSVNVALTVADRAVFMEKGEIRFSGPTAELLDRDDILRAVFLSGAASLEGER